MQRKGYRDRSSLSVPFLPFLLLFHNNWTFSLKYDPGFHWSLLSAEFGFVLSACHVNHGLRGESADRDEAFVRAECARLGVPLRVFHAAEMADEVGLPSEHAGALRVCVGRG